MCPSPSIAGSPGTFDPATVTEFRFGDRDYDPASGRVRLRYALDDTAQFEELIEIPTAGSGDALPAAALDGALDLLQLATGVSYFKAADPPRVDSGNLRMTPALAELATLLYREGLAEYRFANDRDVSAGPAFSANAEPIAPAAARAPAAGAPLLVPIGGGKDSVVTIEALKRAGHEIELFSVGDMEPIARTATVAGRPRLVAKRTLDPALLQLNANGALNGHVPVTAIVSAVALLTALVNGHGAVVMSNERSAGSGSFELGGVDVNHQFSKGFVAERAFAAAAAELCGGPEYFSLLRPASELAIARAFATMADYHGAFTSCNAVFRIDPERRASNWCGDCPKCRFVWLVLAPFLSPGELEAIFGRDLYRDESQYDGFAALVALADEKPFECVGTPEESAVAVQLAAADPRWDGHSVLNRLAAALEAQGVTVSARDVFALADEHAIPDRLLPALREALDAAG